MGKYREAYLGIRSPFVVDAEQFFENSEDGWPLNVFTEGGRFFLGASGGDLPLSDGDWIITGVQGELYTCSGDRFKEAYAPIEKQS